MPIWAFHVAGEPVIKVEHTRNVIAGIRDGGGNPGMEEAFMEFFEPSEMPVLSNPGVTSLQLLCPDTSDSERITLTRVTVEPGHTQPRHSHAASEQIWIAVTGEGILLLEGDEERAFSPGQVARFADGNTHGLRNGTSSPFEYISVTSPPLSFTKAYRQRS